MIPAGLIGIDLIGVVALAFVLYKAWRWWLGEEPSPPSIHVAGEDDQRVDFAAALSGDDLRRARPRWDR